MRIATYNVQNLFRRAKVLNLDTTGAAKAVLEDVQRLNELIGKAAYSAQDKADIMAMLMKHDVENEAKRAFLIQQVRGKLYSQKAGTPLGKTNISQIKAGGRGDWDGWIELERELVSTAAIENTARVIEAVDADVLCAVEVESRPSLVEFNARFLKSPKRYPHRMLIDGNDKRGIDVGLFSRFAIGDMRSHVDNALPKSAAEPNVASKARFSRDCAEFSVQLPGGKVLWVLCNHFKSRGFGSKAGNDQKREREAAQVRKILGRFDLAKDLVAVCGDFNEVPSSVSLSPLLAGLPNLRNVFEKLPAGADRWTHRDDATANEQIDYLLVSKPLFAACTQAGVERRGVFRKNTPANTRFPTVTGDKDAASDHAAVWAEFKV
jgi:endonuclease/exonuclease/phosphatase family metal-dependent hydrolase